jgi:hypothetical protein
VRLTHRKDENQDEIVKALRAVGCSVTSLANVGEGCPDLLIGLHGWTGLGECKVDDPKDKRRVKLREKQQRFRLHWRGGPILTLTGPAQAVELIMVARDVSRETRG